MLRSLFIAALLLAVATVRAQQPEDSLSFRHQLSRLDSTHVTGSSIQIYYPAAVVITEEKLPPFTTSSRS